WEGIKNKRYRESLRDNADLIRQSRELAKIKTDVEIKLDLKELETKPPDRAAAYELFKELEFNSLVNELADAAPVARITHERNYSLVRNKAELDALVQRLWQSENVGVALSNSSAAGAGQQQSTHDSQGAHGIALAPHEGESAFIDLENFAE